MGPVDYSFIAPGSLVIIELDWQYLCNRLLKHSPNWERGVYVTILAEVRRFLKLVCHAVAEIAQLGERQTEDLKVPGSHEV